MRDFTSWLRSEWDRVLGFSLVALGAIFLVVGYAGVSGSPYAADQLSYIVSGGLGGLFCLGAGATFLITADIHDEWRKLDQVEDALRSKEITVTLPESGDGSDGPAPAPAPAEGSHSAVAL
jgi:hypothetical protein